jgi:hypothetical protein
LAFFASASWAAIEPSPPLVLGYCSRMPQVEASGAIFSGSAMTSFIPSPSARVFSTPSVCGWTSLAAMNVARLWSEMA